MVTRKTKANFPFGCDIPKLFSNCLLAQPKWRPLRINFMYYCLSQKYRNVNCVDIIYLMLYKINNYTYSLFDKTLSIVYKNNLYSVIGDHMRRMKNDRLENAK